MQNFNKLYKESPLYLKTKLQQYRITHIPKKYKVKNTPWEYISSGSGNTTILFLPGGIGINEIYFLHIMELEDNFKIIAPTYPAVSNVSELIEGIVEILNKEKIKKVNIIGASFGGILAQCIAAQHPEIVSSLTLSNTASSDVDLPQTVKGNRIKSLKKILKVTAFMPLIILRSFFLRKLSKLAIETGSESKFWHAFFKEAIFYKISKEASISLSKCMIDFAENYTFTKDSFSNFYENVLIMESDNDKSFNVEEQKALHKLFPKARKHLFKNCGHIALITKRSEYLSIVKTFLKNISSYHSYN